MKIFICGIDTQLGYHLTEFLRQDHLLLEGYSLISGTITTVENFYMLHESIHKTFDFSKQRDVAVKQAVESDVVIVDLRNDPAAEVEFILKVLKHYNAKKPLKVIGISNFTTWSNTQTTQFISTPHDKQLLLEYSLNKQHWQSSFLNKIHYPLRVPHPMFVYNYLLEEQVLQLKNFCEMIQPIVLCTGVVYGRSGFDLRNQVEQAIKGEKSWVMDLRNQRMIERDAMVPLLHIDQLLGQIQNIVYGNQQSTDSKHQQYKVFCEDEPKSIVKVVEMMNELCGNMIQFNSLKNDSTKEDNSPSPGNQLAPPPNQLTNQFSTRSATSGNLHISTSQSSRNTQTQSISFIPELTFAKDKRKFSLLMNLKFSSTNEKVKVQQTQKEKGKQSDDTLIGKVSENEGMQDNMAKVKGENESQLSAEKKWIQSLIQEFTEYYQCEFRHFLLPEELLKALSQDQQNSENITQNILNRYFLINDKVLSEQLSIMLVNGMISQERLTTPEQEKKIPNNKNPQNRESIRKQPYEILFPELIRHVLDKKQLSHFVICLKNQLIVKLISLFNEPDFEKVKNMKFINLVSKESIQNTSYISVNQNIQKSIEILSDEFFSVYGINNPKLQNFLKGQTIELDEQEPNKAGQKSRKVMNGPNQVSNESSEQKINLMSQYLLDNLIVYLAEAKQQLQMKGKLRLGQKFEGKENIKLFIEELKHIRAREVKLACEEEE